MSSLLTLDRQMHVIVLVRDSSVMVADRDDLSQVSHPLMYGPSHDGYEFDTASIKGSIGQLRIRVGAEIASITVAIEGHVHPERSHMVESTDVPHWQGRSVSRDLQNAFECPVLLGTHTEAVAWSEALRSSDFAASFWLVKWDESFDAVFMHPLSGPDGTPRYISLPTQAGHLPVRQASGSKACVCGRLDCAMVHLGTRSFESILNSNLSVRPATLWIQIIDMLRTLHMVHETGYFVMYGKRARAEAQWFDRLRKSLSESIYSGVKPDIVASKATTVVNLRHVAAMSAGSFPAPASVLA